MGDRLLILGFDLPGVMLETWSLDQPGGTLVELDGLLPTSEYFAPSYTLVECEGRVFAADRTAEAGVPTDVPLWLGVTDGTPGGTSGLSLTPAYTPLNTGSDLDEPRRVGACFGSGPMALLSPLATRDEGSEWILLSEGAQQPVRVLDLNPGPPSSRPEVLGRVGGRLLVAADRAAEGRELHGISIPKNGGYVAEPLLPECGASLTASEPVAVGQVLGLGVDSTQAASTALLFTGFQASWIALAPGCVQYVADPALFAAAATDDAGLASFSIAVPAFAPLVGLRVLAQAAVANPAGPAFGAFELSNGLDLVFGN